MNGLIPQKGFLRSWVELYGPLSEAPDEAHLGTAIATLSALVGWRVWLKWGENAEPCTVNVVLEGPSASARKTTTAGTAGALARELPKFDDVKLLSVTSISHTSGRGLLDLVAPSDDEIAEKWETESPPGHLFVWDEFGYILGRPDDIKGTGWEGQIRSTVMLLANGRHGGVQLGSMKKPGSRCAVSILATMTRHELERRVSQGLLSDGFMGRFLLIPHGGRQRLLPEPPKWTPAMTEQRKSMLRWLTTLAYQEEEVGDAFALQSGAARQCRNNWYAGWVERLEKQTVEDDASAGAAALSAFQRLQTTAMKMAVLAAISTWDGSSKLSELRIEGEHMDYAQRLADVALHEVVELSNTGGRAEKDQFAEKVLEWLDKHPKPITKKNLLDRIRLNGLDRQIRWNVIRGLHPEDLYIHIMGEGRSQAEWVFPTKFNPSDFDTDV